MTTRLAACTVVTCLLALSACSTGGSAGTGDRSGPDAGPALMLGALGPQEAAPNQCYMALWTLSEPSHRIVVAYDNPAQASVNIRGKAIDLPRTETSGAERLGIFESQTFAASGYVLTTRVSFETPPGSIGMSTIRSAVVSLTDKKGEAVVIPAIGIASCGAQSPDLKPGS